MAGSTDRRVSGCARAASRTPCCRRRILNQQMPQRFCAQKLQVHGQDDKQVCTDKKRCALGVPWGVHGYRPRRGRRFTEIGVGQEPCTRPLRRRGHCGCRILTGSVLRSGVAAARASGPLLLRCYSVGARRTGGQGGQPGTNSEMDRDVARAAVLRDQLCICSLRDAFPSGCQQPIISSACFPGGLSPWVGNRCWAAASIRVNPRLDAARPFFTE